MAKDSLGNTLRVNDKVLFNGLIYTIKEIQENRILGGKHMTQNRGMAIKIPDSIVLEVELPFDAEKPFNGFVVKTPPEGGTAEA